MQAINAAQKRFIKITTVIKIANIMLALVAIGILYYLKYI